ncbi:hypothetical protein SCLCIDRAFT_334856 [Scleroderma citrinum Foug A]|uniref:Uncharacterized protein n=1 Tax=Scleroderma citrinum Foug A TaxID=1036808 RepID=A0A0C3DEX4_9AGAM|nr:hypothetical protein SCLCIDRAFT_334856 [Scleroderma citrinum Foug A]
MALSVALESTRHIINAPQYRTFGNATKVLAVSSVSILRFGRGHKFMLSIPIYSEYRAARQPPTTEAYSARILCPVFHTFTRYLEMVIHW